MIRVCVVDDEMLVRQGIRRLLELDAEIAIAGEARDGEEALRVIEEVSPDVVLLDVRMPRLDGVGVVQRLRARQKLPPCLILTTFDDGEVVLEAIKSGARGYLLKDVSFEQLVGAIRTLAAGGTMFQPAITDRLLRGLDHVRADFPSLEPPDPLTDRETEILRLMAGGYSNREIARALHAAEGTIKNHVSSVLSKLGVRDRTRAVLKALESGLI